MERKALTDLPPSAWIHPADRAAQAVLSQLPLVDQALKGLAQFTSDRSLRLMFLGSALRVGPLQAPRVHRLVAEASRILGLPAPETFLVNDPRDNAFVVGLNTPLLVLHSALVQRLNDDELLSVIGHELGHIKAGHLLYKTLLYLFAELAVGLGWVQGLAQIPLLLALRQWEQAAEFSCDRAGLLVCQNPEAGQTTLVKLAAGDQADLDLDEMDRQALEYEQAGDLLDSLFKTWQAAGLTHPLTLVRLRALRQWVAQGRYQALLEGQFETASDTGAEFQAAFRDWEAELKASQDPLAKGTSQAVDSLKDLGRGLEDFWRIFIQG